MSKRANHCIQNGEYTDAEYYFKKISQIDELNWRAWYGRGLCFKRMDMYERAIHCFSRVVELDETNAKGWYNLGFSQTQTENLEDALYSLNKAIKIDPNYAISYVIKSWLFYKHGNFDNSRKLISYVKEYHPKILTSVENKETAKEPKDLQICHKMLFETI